MSYLEYFRVNGWHQGAIIDDKSAIQALLKNSCGNKFPDSPLPEFLVIISQNCDILHHKVEDEPYIDFLKGHYNEKIDGNLLHGKNPRNLQIKHNNKIIGFSILDILHVTKDTFQNIDPKHSSFRLEKKEIKLIINWISKRYARAAFPDAFNKRLSEEKSIEKASKNPFMSKVSLIFIDITDEELETDQNYNATMVIGIKHGSDLKNMSQIEDLFYETFNIPGIKTEVEVYDEYDITYETIYNYKRFDWDFRSLPGNSEVAAPLDCIDAV